MKHFIRWSCSTIVLLVICSACSTLHVNTDYNPAYDFTRLKTYAWLNNGQPPSNDPRINNDLIVDRVHTAVENVLASKGYVKTEAASADFLVSWLGAIDKKLQVETIEHFYSPYGYGALYQDPFWMGSMRSSIAREYEVGTLVLDILDPQQQKLIWRGSGSKEHLTINRNPEAITQGINDAIMAILENFPVVQ